MLNLINLDTRVRRYMLDEVNRDIDMGTLYLSKRLSLRGQRDYVTLLKRAIRSHDEDWLAAELGQHGRMRDVEERRSLRNGGYATIPVPPNAARLLAEGEFNRFYIRGVCRAALDDGRTQVLVYRAKRVASPRRRSQRLLGKLLSAKILLEDLRSNPGRDTWLGVPAGVFSGISVCLPGRICAQI